MEPAREDLGKWHLRLGEQPVKKPKGVGECGQWGRSSLLSEQQ